MAYVTVEITGRTPQLSRVCKVSSSRSGARLAGVTLPAVVRDQVGNRLESPVMATTSSLATRNVC